MAAWYPATGGTGFLLPAHRVVTAWAAPARLSRCTSAPTGSRAGCGGVGGRASPRGVARHSDALLLLRHNGCRVGHACNGGAMGADRRVHGGLAVDEPERAAAVGRPVRLGLRPGLFRGRHRARVRGGRRHGMAGGPRMARGTGASAGGRPGWRRGAARRPVARRPVLPAADGCCGHDTGTHPGRGGPAPRDAAAAARLRGAVPAAGRPHRGCTSSPTPRSAIS